MGTNITNTEHKEEILQFLGLVPGALYTFDTDSNFLPKKLYPDSVREYTYGTDINRDGFFTFTGAIDSIKFYEVKTVKKDSSYIPVPTCIINQSSAFNDTILSKVRNTLYGQINAYFKRIYKKKEYNIVYKENHYESRWFSSLIADKRQPPSEHMKHWVWAYKQNQMSFDGIFEGQEDISMYFIRGGAEFQIPNYSFAMQIIQNGVVGWMFVNKKTLEEVKAMFKPF